MRPFLCSLGFLCLLGGLACRKPEVAPPFEAQVARAAREAAGSAGPVATRTDYVEGFLNGARMVEAAVAANRRPYLLAFGAPDPIRPAGPLPPGASVAREIPPQVELDPETGLEVRRLGDPAGPAYSRGQVAGFRWAFARRRAALARPQPVPAAPTQWVRVADARPVWLQEAGARVEVRWTSEALFWSTEEKGFPASRMWRPLREDQAPRAFALGGGALWVDFEAGALALDLGTGVVRAAGPHPPTLPEQTLDFAALMAREREAHVARRPALQAAAQAGDTAAMRELGRGSDGAEEAAGWFRKAAQAGDPQGMFDWATRLFQGAGVPEDKGEARVWFERAAKAGHSGAAEVLKGLFGGS